jgi:hypothetical protein
MTEIEIIEEAYAAARKATDAHVAQVKNQYPCGFAWVNIKPARGKLVNELKRRDLGSTDSYYGGYTIWNPSGHYTQNMFSKLDGADAFAMVLRKYGINATAHSRMD